jgi:DNA-binding NtrC family response regulator
MENGTKVPLIADSDSEFLDSIRKETEGRPFAPMVASAIQSGLEVLIEQRAHVAILIVSTAFARDDVLNTIYAAHRALPGLPIALLVSNGIVLFSDEELKKMRVQSVIKKPITFDRLMSQLISVYPSMRERAKHTDQDFAPVEIQNHAATEQVTEDVYVRIRGDRYIKVLRAGYALGTERLERYVRRGIKSFYRSRK